MNKIPAHIFRTYDIRGINDVELTDESVELIGKGFGTFLAQRGTHDCVIGHDTRVSSERFQAAFTKGLLSTGCNVHDVGLALASVIYWSRHAYNIDGAVMVTASHNPPNYNGFKLCSGINAIVDEEIQDLRMIIEEGKFVQGSGKLSSLPDANEQYYAAIREKVTVVKPLKVVIDAGHGTPSLFIPAFLRSLGCEVVVLHENVDSSFPAGVPDPVNPEFQKATMAAVLAHKADVGILMDADGDRAGFVDDKGNMWMGDMILDVFVRDFLPKYPGEKVVVELKDSEIVVEDTERLGGKAIFWKTGHALLDHKVFEEKAILCAEMSCHYWVAKDWYVFDDAVFAMAHLLRILSENTKKFSELMAEIPQYPVTPEIRFACPEEKKEEIVQSAVAYFKEKCDKAVLVDGIRGYAKNGWFLLRKSNTQPLLTIRAEAKTTEDLEDLKKFISDHMRTYPEIDFDWNRQYDKA